MSKMYVIRRRDRSTGEELPGHHGIFGSVLCAEEGLRIVFSNCMPGGRSDRHEHRAVQVFFVLEGSVEMEVGGVETVLEAGDCAVVLPGELHSMKTSGNASYLAITGAPSAGR